MKRFWTHYTSATKARYRYGPCLCWLLWLGVLVAAAETPALTDAQSDAHVLMPPRVGLMEVHQPPLDTLEPEIRTQVIALHNSLAAQTQNPAATTLQLSEAYGVMGQVYQVYALISSAKACYWNAHQLAPQDFRWTYLLAHVLQQEGQAEEALRYYTEARGLQPDYLAVPVQMGNLSLQLHRLEDATAHFQEALALNAHCTAARYGLGQVALSQRKYGEAAAHL